MAYVALWFIFCVLYHMDIQLPDYFYRKLAFPSDKLLKPHEVVFSSLNQNQLLKLYGHFLNIYNLEFDCLERMN